MFTELVPRYVGFAHDGEPLHVFSTRIAFLRGVFDFFIRGDTAAAPDRLQAFVDRLRRDFELTVLTLNYDDLMDRTGPWFDGFAHQGFDEMGHSRSIAPVNLLNKRQFGVESAAIRSLFPSIIQTRGWCLGPAGLPRGLIGAGGGV